MLYVTSPPIIGEAPHVVYQALKDHHGRLDHALAGC
jgi:hypothetical protein